MKIFYHLVIKSINFETNSHLVLTLNDKLPIFELNGNLELDVVCNAVNITLQSSYWVAPVLCGIYQDEDLYIIYKLLIPYSKYLTWKDMFGDFNEHDKKILEKVIW